MSGDITVPARNHSHGAAKAKKGDKRKNGPVSYLTVNRQVWEAALYIAERHVERITVLTPTKVEVWTVGGNSGK